MDTGNHVPGMFIWGFIKAWEIQDRYLQNQLKYDPYLTRRLVRRMLVHDGEHLSRHSLQKSANTNNILFLYRRRLLRIISRLLHTKRN